MKTKSIFLLLMITAFPLIVSAQFRNTNRDYHPKWNKNGESLIFYSYRSSDSLPTPGIFEILIDGNDEKRITNLSGSHPNISYDGSMVVFSARVEEGINRLHIIDAKNGELIRVIDHGDNEKSAYHSTWTKDGRIVFDVEDQHGSVIMIVNSDGSELETIIEQMNAGLPSLYDNDKKILFTVRHDDGTSGIYSSSIEGDDVTEILCDDSMYLSHEISPDLKTLLFTNNRTGNIEIYSKDLESGLVSQLTSNEVDDFFPRWSPDGKTIAFASEIYGFSEVLIMDADGSNVRNVTRNSIQSIAPQYIDNDSFVFLSSKSMKPELYLIHNRSIEQLTKSNDKIITSLEVDVNRKQVYYISTFQGESYINKLDLRTKKEEVLLTLNYEVIRLTISPDGNKIVYEMKSKNSSDLYFYDFETEQGKLIANSESNESSPIYHPDGKSIYYNKYENENFEIYKYEIVSGRNIQVTNTSEHEVYPRISPDGKSVVYNSAGKADWDIFIANLNATNKQIVTELKNYELFPSWSPNGEKLIFQSSVNGNIEVYEMEISTQKIIQLTSLGEVHFK